MDLFVVPTVSFRLLYGLLIMSHGRRQILWLGVTARPTAEWIANQLTAACGWEQIPRDLIRDRNACYGCLFVRRVRSLGIRDHPTCDRSVAIELVENLSAIDTWRQTLSEHNRRRLNTAQAIVKQRRLATAGQEREHDLAKAALTAWRRFCACANALPPDQAAPLWQMARSEAAALLKALELECWSWIVAAFGKFLQPQFNFILKIA